MTNETYEAVILTEESDYELDEELAESFSKMDITVGPKIDHKNTENEKNSPVGTVDNCVYNPDRGIVADITIYDDHMVEMISEGLVSLCPTIARDIQDQSSLQGLDAFLSLFPGEEVGPITRT